MFEMNKLFEEYVGRLVSRALAGTEYRVSLQGGREYCLTAQDDGRRVFQTKPDILIWRGGAIVHVIDTKWKRISSRIDDPKQGVSQSDIYQMMAYAHLYRAPRLTLLYPHHGQLSRGAGIQGQFWITDRATALETASIDVSTDTDDQIVALLRDLIVPSLTEDSAGSPPFTSALELVSDP